MRQCAPGSLGDQEEAAGEEDHHAREEDEAHAEGDAEVQPEVGLIVKFNAANSRWEDQVGRNWNPAVRFSLPDKDVFAIDAMAPTPAETGFFTGVGSVLFNMVVNPVSGKVYVSNTEARNEVRFEGPGVFAGSSVRGHLHVHDAARASASIRASTSASSAR